MIKEFGTKERGLGESCEHGGQQSPVDCPPRKSKGCAGHGGWGRWCGSHPAGDGSQILGNKEKGVKVPGGDEMGSSP